MTLSLTLTPARTQWFSDHKHLFTTMRLALTAVGATLLVALVFTIPWFLIGDGKGRTSMPSSGVRERVTCGRGFLFSEQAATLFFVLSILMLAVTVFKVRHAKDDFHLRNDCIVTMACFVMIIIAGAALSVLAFLASSVVALNLSFFAVVTHKIVLSYRSAAETHRALRKVKRQTAAAGESLAEAYTIKDLHDVMNDPELLKEFYEHLRSEFSVENMIFYQRASSWTQQAPSQGDESLPAATIEERNCEAALIYAEFIARDGSLEVNICNNTYMAIHKEIHDALTSFDVAEFRVDKRRIESARPIADDVFKRACREIYKLMDKDTLVRFKIKHLRALGETPSSSPLGMCGACFRRRGSGGTEDDKSSTFASGSGNPSSISTSKPKAKAPPTPRVVALSRYDDFAQKTRNAEAQSV